MTENKHMLAIAIAEHIKSSGCNIAECISVLAVNIAAVIGENATNIDEVERYCAKASNTIAACARDIYEESHI